MKIENTSLSLNPIPLRNRIDSIDVLRGLVMVIMALDHVRDFFYKSDFGKAANVAMDPTNLETTYPMLFFTRWITHFCAPLFIFLAGTSIYLMCLKKPKKELSMFLFKRGLWLVFLELTVVTFSWSFNPSFTVFFLQVIWAIGISMILLSLLVHLPYKIILSIGLLIVVGHNLMDVPSISAPLKGSTLADLVYFSNFSFVEITKNHFAIIVYSFLPWMGLMLLGFCFGKLFEPSTDAAYRRKKMLQLGLFAVTFFVALRLSNLYGDPVPWTSQPRGTLYTLLSFFNLNKYPPSLLFMCMTVGPGILFLLLIEKVQNRVVKILTIYGKVPMLYYILHFYIIHSLLVIVFYLQGFGANDIASPNNPFFFKPDGIGFGLWGIYVIWLIVIAILFPICRWYGEYKSTHRYWWLAYL